MAKLNLHPSLQWHDQGGIMVALTVRKMYLSKGPMHATITTKPNEYGEYVVKFYYNLEELPDNEYFTDDGADAEATARATLRFMTGK